MDSEIQFCNIKTLKSKERECHKLTSVTLKAIILFTSLLFTFIRRQKKTFI